MQGNTLMPKSLSSFLDDLEIASEIVRELLVRASTVDDRIWLLEVLRILDKVETLIVTKKLTARNAAIKELTKSLTDSGNSLQEVHARAKKLAARLKLVASQVEALSRLASVLQS
jgi:hypothetical protein